MKPVSDLYSSKCPVCGGQKRVRFIVIDDPVYGTGEKRLVIKDGEWGESPPSGNKETECFCAQCGIKFIYPY